MPCGCPLTRGAPGLFFPVSTGTASNTSLHRQVKKDPSHFRHESKSLCGVCTWMSHRHLSRQVCPSVLISPQIPRLLWSPLPRKRQPLSSMLISDPPFLRCPCSVYQQIPCSRLSSAALSSAPPPQYTRVVLSTETGSSVQRGPRTSGSATRQKRKGKKRCKDCEEETNQNLSQIICNY